MHHADEGIDRDVHCLGESATRAIDHAGMKVLLGTERHRVQTDIDAPPRLVEPREDLRVLLVIGDIERQDDLRLELFRHRPYEPFGLFRFDR